MSRQRRKVPWLELRRGTYYVYWYTEGPPARTKRKSLGTSNHILARQRYAEALAQGHTLFADLERSSGLTVSRALDDYRAEHVEEKVVDKDRCDDAITHLKAWFKATTFTDVDIPATRAYAAARRSGLVGREGSDGTIRRELVVLRAAAGHAARWRRIGPSANPPTPMPSIELPAEGVHETLWLTTAEMARAIELASGRLRDFMLLAYYTGARRKSIERLTRFQVDLPHNRINLSSPHETDNQRRSKKRRPIIPIDAKIRPVVERLLAESTTEWVFGDPKDMFDTFNAHMIKIGYPDRAFPHVLRHSRATHLLQSGVPIYDVARLLGDTVATVEKRYGHHSPEALGAALERKA